MTERRVSTNTVELTAVCRECQFGTVALNGLGNVARHHTASGHTIDVRMVTATIYGDPHRVSPEQTNMLDELEETPKP